MPALHREAGLATWADPGADRPVREMPTVQCVHCGGHFQMQIGSGRHRGFCMNCNGFVCGPGCFECVPVEQYLDNLEAGRDPNFRPTQSFVPAGKVWTPGDP